MRANSFAGLSRFGVPWTWVVDTNATVNMYTAAMREREKLPIALTCLHRVGPLAALRCMKIGCALLGLAAALCLAGCESTEASNKEDTTTRGNIRLADEHNYRSDSTLSIPTVETASGTDLDICWSEVTKDLQCHDVAPIEDLDTVALLRFRRLTEEQVERRLTGGQLAMSEVDGYLDYKTDHRQSCAKLSAMTLFGTKIDIEEEYTESDDHTYLLLFAVGTTPGVGARAMMFIKPSSSSTNTKIDAESSCGYLEFTADLEGAEPLPIPAEGPWVVDWRDVEKDSQGLDLAYEAIDGVLIGFYEGKTAADLQADIFDLELEATALWEMELEGGRTADLAKAKLRGGDARFSGFERDAEGTWLLGLTCSTCQNPAPLVLTILEPTDES